MSIREAISEIIERHKHDYQFGDDTLHGAIDGAVRDAMAAANIKPDTAYMEVPRCDRCRWWRTYLSLGSWVLDMDLHECARPSQDGARFEASTSGGAPILTDSDFGCVQFEARQEPL